MLTNFLSSSFLKFIVSKSSLQMTFFNMGKINDRGHIHMISAQEGDTPKHVAVRKLRKGGMHTRGVRISENFADNMAQLVSQFVAK